MKKKFLAALLLIIVGFAGGAACYYYIFRGTGPGFARRELPPAGVRLNLKDTDRDFSQVVAAVSPSVVNIATTRKGGDPLIDLFLNEGLPGKRKQQSLGSGLIVSADGFIMTNYHVIENAEEIRVTLFNKSSHRGKVIGNDPKTDLALLKVEARGLPAVTWGDSESLHVGEFVLAIGNPFGLSHTVTMGIVSAIGRANVGIADYEDFIQTDAAINPGNSGGPLVNVRGELIGINTAIFSRSGGYQGIGFAVPSSMAKSVFEQLVRSGKVVRGWIGVTIQDLTPELAESFGLRNTSGALVSDILKGSPADKAGIRKGDIILAFDGKDIQNVSVLRNTVAQGRIGSKAEIKVVRNKNVKQFQVAVVEYPREYSIESMPEISTEPVRKEVLGGITVIQLTKDFARQLGVSAEDRGVVIVHVEPGSPAEDAGLREGDVIQEIDRQPVQSLKDFNTLASAVKNNATIILYINRNGRKSYFTLRAL